MKTTLRIFAILVAVLLVAGGIYSLVENISIPSSIGGGSERPSRTQVVRPEGDYHNEWSLTRGFFEVGQSLIKIGIITVLVLGIQFIFNKFNVLKKTKTAAA